MPNWKSYVLLVLLLVLSACASSPAVAPGVVVTQPKVDYGVIPSEVLNRKPQPAGYWTRRLWEPLTSGSEK